MSEADWRKAIAFCDRMQLTLPLGLSCADRLPEWVRLRIDRDLEKNAERWLRTKAAYREIAAAFAAEGLQFAVLKGFSHCPRFVGDPRHRFQGDLDLLLSEKHARQACGIAASLGYEPIRPGDRHPTNHLPTMIRKTGWAWRGDYFDVDMPLALELHFRVWDEQTEGFGPSGIERFWERRQSVILDGVDFLALHPADAVGNASLHLLAHLLRGSLRLNHVYELAWMLHQSTEDTYFWNSWSELHDDSLRRLEALCFSLAQRWFNCCLPKAALGEIERLPADVARWLNLYSASPLEGKFHPNKDELWLHWVLLDSSVARFKVLRRRLLPEQLPGPVAAVHVPKQDRTWRIRLESGWRYLVYVSSRVTHHARALPPTALSAFRWFGGGLGLGRQYWRFFFAEGFFDFGMFIFVFLYSLYLLQLGFGEKFVGRISGSMTAGSIVGTILAAIVMRRLGIKRTLLVAFGLTAAVSAVRALELPGFALLGLAALGGLVSAVWPVALAPMVAQVTTAKSRPLGFSLTCSSGIAIGILGGLAAGRLPGWLSRMGWATAGAPSYRAALLAGCAIVLLALWPLSRMRMEPTPQSGRWLLRPSPAVVRFLIAMAAWNLGTGMFNPFHQVFFARLHMPVEQIGYTVSFSQLGQVVAILASPLVFRKFGLARGIAGMQFATGIALLWLAAAGTPLVAAAGYCAFMMAQYMSEPGMFTLLMEGASTEERSSASALNFLVSFAGQAVAATVSGQLIERYGYAPVLTGAAVICGAAAILFRVLFDAPKPSAPSIP